MGNAMKQTNKQHIFSSFTLLNKFILVAKNILININVIFVFYGVISEK